MSWRDCGYQITAMANWTILVDNNAWNNTHISRVGQVSEAADLISMANSCIASLQGHMGTAWEWGNSYILVNVLRYMYQLEVSFANIFAECLCVVNQWWSSLFCYATLCCQAMSSPEEKAYEIMRELDVNYVLVIFGGLTGYASDGGSPWLFVWLPCFQFMVFSAFFSSLFSPLPYQLFFSLPLSLTYRHK